jgi:hypothetical protein
LLRRPPKGVEAFFQLRRIRDFPDDGPTNRPINFAKEQTVSITQPATVRKEPFLDPARNQFDGKRYELADSQFEIKP